jgi:hypothetical protein
MRQILNRMRRNARERRGQHVTQWGPRGSMLTQIPMRRHLLLEGSLDDCERMFHAFTATLERARSNPRSFKLRPEEVMHFRAFAEIDDEWPRRRAERSLQPVRICFRGLGMGDQAAADIATEAHGEEGGRRHAAT